MKIKIITVWFGPFPSSIHAWMKSVSGNPAISFLMLTDQKKFFDLLEYEYPNNLALKFISFEEFKANVRQIMKDDSIVLDRPYKLCDYKPAYGEIFQEELVGFDYWGYCDIDLVFGDLKALFEKESLYVYDRFLTLGHLCLYKNTWEHVTAYRTFLDVKVNWEITCHTNKVTVFDESQNGIYEIYQKLGFKQFERRVFADINKYKRRFTSVLRTPEDRSSRLEIFLYRGGQLVRVHFSWFQWKIDEIGYVHFPKRRMTDAVSEKYGWERTNEFVLCEKGFYPYQSSNLMKMILRLNPYRGLIYELFEELHGIKKFDPYLLVSGNKLKEAKKYFIQIWKIVKGIILGHI